MSLDEAFAEYLAYLASIDVSVERRLGSPATDDELARLHDYLDGDVPADLRRWFQLCNGVDLDHPGTTTNESTYLLPRLRPRPLRYLLDTIESTSGRFEAEYEVASPVQLDGPTPVRPFPVALVPETTGGLWVECAEDGKPGRVIWASEGEDGHYLDGYYHETLADFIRGVLTNLRDGRFTIVDDGISIPYSTSYYDRYRIDVTRPAGAKRTSSAPEP